MSTQFTRRIERNPSLTEQYTGTMILNDLALVDDLMYASYSHQRQLFPEVAAERWQKIYGPSAVEMESRYQKESPCQVSR